MNTLQILDLRDTFLGHKKDKKEVKSAEAPALPSMFGSHRSMVDKAETLRRGHMTGRTVVCRDEKGAYSTEAWRLDSGIADPNRHSWQGRGVTI